MRVIWLFDMIGNVEEWCVGPSGEAVARGGAFNVLPRMRDSIGIVELAITVMDNLHSSGNAVSTGYSIAPDVNPHNRQISRADSHIDIIGRIVGQT